MLEKKRWAEVRWPTPLELKATTVLRLPINEASAKIRTGPPLDDEEDMGAPCWAGVIPLRLATAAPIPDPAMDPTRPAPSNVAEYHRPTGATLKR